MLYSSSHLEWLSQLVAFDTTSRNSNLSLINFIRDYLISLGIESRLTYDHSQLKANLFATLPGREGNIEGGILLSGHTDVVPVDGQQWETDPFCATQIENKIYGRGTCDMKGFIAVVLALLPKFKQLNLDRPVHFAFSYDEEVGCLGARSLIKDFQQQGIKPDACIVGEPTAMRPVVAHKGINVFRCQVHGNAAHSSLTPEGCNAIEYAAELISKITETAHQFRLEGPYDKYYDVPFTSISTNLIQGGNAVNTIPKLCEFIFEYRNLPTVDPHHIILGIRNYIQDVLLKKMHQDYSDAKIEIEPIATVPAFEAIDNANITQLMRTLTHDTAIHKVAYATEAGLFQQAGIPTIVCGPGSIEQAHRANEFVSLEQLEHCEKFLMSLLMNFGNSD